jgi:hypothetical protein
VRIKALSLSQSKQEKRTEEVITVQRGKDSWNQRPQTSGSSTPPLTRAPPPPACVPRLHAHYHHPSPPFQRTTAAHAPFVAHPPPLPPATPSPLHHTCCLVSPAPTPPLHTLAYRSPIKSPPPAPSIPMSLKAKTHLIKNPLPNSKQLHFPLPRP